MATTQLESGSFMVGMDCDCKSASMNKPLCAHTHTDSDRACLGASCQQMKDLPPNSLVIVLSG